MTDRELGAHLTDQPAAVLDDLAEDMVPVAARFVATVHERDADTVRRALSKFTGQEKDALLVVLAAMVPDGISVDVLLGWLDDGADQKQCNHCGEVKPRSQFHRDKTTADGRRGECRNCNAVARRRAA